MLSSNRFLQVIAEHIVFPAKKLKALEGIDPSSFYVENLRAVLGTGRWLAELICETGYRQGVFRKSVQLLCPDGGVARTVPFEEELPETVSCWVEVDGEPEEREEHTDR